MKSNSEPASMRTPNKVEKAPSSTGANMCSSASTARLWRSPMAVRNAYNTHTHAQKPHSCLLLLLLQGIAGFKVQLIFKNKTVTIPHREVKR